VKRAIRKAGWTLGAALLAAGCASGGAGRTSAPATRDRTDDPELAAAREAARPEFETQADALAAGVYEPFVHPDSVRPGAADPAPFPAVIPEGPDPSTEELLGTLGAEGPYNAVESPRDVPPVGGEWTLQLGAFESETGALVRVRQIASDFPDLPRWYEREAGSVRVFVGRFADRVEAERARARVADAGYSDAWVTRVP
jgi:cell division septation protein DedD